MVLQKKEAMPLCTRSALAAHIHLRPLAWAVIVSRLFICDPLLRDHTCCGAPALLVTWVDPTTLRPRPPPSRVLQFQAQKHEHPPFKHDANMHLMHADHEEHLDPMDRYWSQVRGQ